MARSKKTESKSKDTAEIIDRLFAEVDPEVMLAGMLGATASYGGLTPPFTRMLMALTGPAGDSAVSNLVLDYKTLLVAGTGAGIGGALFYYAFKKMWARKEELESNPTEQEQKEIQMTAIAASGFFEGMLMMTFAKNPEFQKKVFDMISGSAVGLGAIAKAL